MTDATTTWTGEVIPEDNEVGPQHGYAFEQCRWATYVAADDLAFLRGDILEVRPHPNYGLTMSILTRNGFRNTLAWDEDVIYKFQRVCGEMSDYFEVDFYDSSTFRSYGYG